MVYMDMFNNENIFNRRLSPAYSNMVGGIRDKSIYSNVRNKLERLRELVAKTYEEVHRLSVYYHTADIGDIYSMIVRIGDLAEEMEDLIDEILEERMPSGRDSEIFKHYLRRIKYEVIMNIENDTSALIYDIEHGDEYGIDYYQFENELIKFIDGAERALTEVGKSIRELLRYV